MKSNKYAVGEEWMIVDEESKEWVNGIITEVGDETVCIKWDDLQEETEYQINDMPRIFHSNADKELNHPDFEPVKQFVGKYPHVLSALNTLYPSPVEKWIKVEDRLPEGSILGSETVLCYNGNHVHTGYVKHGVWWKAATDTIVDTINGWDVTHWQPLPPAPNQNKL